MSAMPSRVVMLSGGAGSWGAARRVVDRHGREGLTLLFADTLIEDDDLYRFLLEATANLTGRRLPPGLLAAPWRSQRSTKGATAAGTCSRWRPRCAIGVRSWSGSPRAATPTRCSPMCATSATRGPIPARRC